MTIAAHNQPMKVNSVSEKGFDQKIKKERGRIAKQLKPGHVLIHRCNVENAQAITTKLKAKDLNSLDVDNENVRREFQSNSNAGRRWFCIGKEYHFTKIEHEDSHNDSINVIIHLEKGVIEFLNEHLFPSKGKVQNKLSGVAKLNAKQMEKCNPKYKRENKEYTIAVPRHCWPILYEYMSCPALSHYSKHHPMKKCLPKDEIIDLVYGYIT